MLNSRGYAALQASQTLVPYRFERREPGPRDVVLQLLYCGICHSDLNAVDDAARTRVFPMVPGHEMIGRVTAIGAEVTRFQVGDLAGIGCIVDSCRECEPCRQDEEQFCTAGWTPSFGGRERATQHPTCGGYSDSYVNDERYTLKIPPGLDPAAAAPLLCAGITTYSPLRRWGVGAGHTVGVLGLGGLGHLAVKFAKAMGARVVMLTSSPSKVGDAQRLGADDVILTTDAAQMAAHRSTLDFLVDTISGDHEPGSYMPLLRPHGSLCLLGLPPKPLTLQPALLVMGARSIGGSLIGGIRQTQEMLDFAAAHGVSAEIERIRIDQVNEAWQRMRRNDVKYRFVIDLASLGSA